MILASHGIIASSGVSQFDADALSFITAASISDSTQQIAINSLVTDLKTYNIWTKIKALYPFVGGTASSHKWNLKDPRDLDAAFRLQFLNGWTHNNTGAVPNGIDAYAKTFLIPSTAMLMSDFSHLSYYSNSNTQKAFEYVMGGGDVSRSLGLIGRRDTNLQYYISTNSTSAYQVASNTSATSGNGFLIGTQLASTIKLFRNNVLQASNTTVSLPLYPSPKQVYIGCVNDNDTSAIGFTDKICSFSSIGDGLTDTEASNFYTAVQAFNTTLNRQV
jgi:hypothetical protein